MDIIEKAFATYLDKHFYNLNYGSEKEPSIPVGDLNETNSGFFRKDTHILGLSENGKLAYTIDAYCTYNIKSICINNQMNHKQLLRYFEAAVLLHRARL